MSSEGRSWQPVLLAGVMAALSGDSPCRASAEGVVVSVVTDPVPGPPARHGMGKSLAALGSKGVVFEKVVSLGEARGRFILAVAGAAGSPAAEAAGSSLLGQSYPQVRRVEAETGARTRVKQARGTPFRL